MVLPLCPNYRDIKQLLSGLIALERFSSQPSCLSSPHHDTGWCTPDLQHRRNGSAFQSSGTIRVGPPKSIVIEFYFDEFTIEPAKPLSNGGWWMVRASKTQAFSLRRRRSLFLVSLSLDTLTLNFRSNMRDRYHPTVHLASSLIIWNKYRFHFCCFRLESMGGHCREIVLIYRQSAFALQT